MDFIGPFCDVLMRLGDPTCRYIEHHRKLEERRHDLQTRAGQLNALRRDAALKKQAELRQWGKIVREDVELWFLDVDNMNNDIQAIYQRVQTVSFFSRARLGKRVAQTVQRVEELIKRGGFTGPLVIDDPSPRRVPIESEYLEGEKRVMAKIWEYLIGDKFEKIGVCGMGGIGKTTIMSHIYRRLLMENQFDGVIWVDVPKNCNITILQQIIAQAMNIVNLPEPKLDRVAALENKLGEGRYVLILDNVWEEFSHFEIGITSKTLSNGSKLVLISRLIGVCASMECKIVEVKRLSNEESKNLFLKHVGLGVPGPPSLEDILDRIVEECDGLPLAIVVIAKSLRKRREVHEWENALTELQEHLTSLRGTDQIYEKLKIGYDHLETVVLKNCFLYCSLYPEGHIIPRMELIEYWIDEEFFETLSRKDLYNRGKVVLDILVDNCLLEKVPGDDVKMHDVMRDTALYITKSSPCFLVKAGEGSTKLPSQQEWKENLEKVSLMKNDISEIPPHLSPNCEILSTLFLQNNRSLTGMSESFFRYMRKLRILDLSYTSITQLPRSVLNLEKLNALVLRECTNLRYLPSLEKLKELRKLDLHRAGIEKVPHGLEMLVNLTYLDLFTECLQELPNGILSRLSCLQYLVLYVESNGIKINGLEAAGLTKLETFEGRFHELVDFNIYCKSVEGRRLTSYLLVMASPEAKFDMRRVFEAEIKRVLVLKFQESPSKEVVRKMLIKASGVQGVDYVSFDARGLLTVIGDMDIVKVSVMLRKLWHVVIFRVCLSSPRLPGKYVILHGGQIRREDPVVLPADLCYLGIFECHNVRSLSDISLFFQKTNELRCCSIHDCREMESLLDLSSSSSPNTPLKNLENLWLGGLENLHTLVKVGEASVVSMSSSGNFSNLKSFRIEGCSNMKQLFPLELVHDLQNLEHLVVRYCGQMKEIVASKEEEENHKGKGLYSPTTFTFPKLRRLELEHLPELKSICSSNGVITCDSLKDIHVWTCPNLKRMPLNLPLFQDAGQSTSCPSLTIDIDTREWWESVEWEYPSAKNILQPFLKIGE